ncbi:CDP-glycerol glycerophosphotransferase family protein [Peribacillus sp. SCS-155]|uniref:CDP-glycerol glycerophosphotransferase family protein n=1 Tax=Peribacillus sedimenti TaxID=3115297 RepID=UPI003906512D
MVRDLAIEGYLLIFRAVFSFFRLFPLKSKAVFVSSFGDNSWFILNEMDKQQLPIKRVVLKKKSCKIDIKGDGDTIVFHFETKNLIHMLLSIYHLATSRWIIADNYFGFLSAVNFKKGVKVVQIWHAAGAVKKFASKDPSIKFRSERARNRFLKVYSQFDYVTAGSDIMGDIFKESFQIGDGNILKTGVPRTDFFFDQKAKQTAYRALKKSFPELEGKRTILYAPTYRNEELKTDKLALDLDLLYRELEHEDYVLLLKLHPAVTADIDFSSKYPGFVYDLSTFPDVNQLLLITDVLVTDYSSIPFEYSLLQKPMIFFAYDLEEYSKERGFWEDYKDSMPGPVVYTTADLLMELKKHDYDVVKIEQFRKKWNHYSDGHSSKKLVSFLFGEQSQ